MAWCVCGVMCVWYGVSVMWYGVCVVFVCVMYGVNGV